MNKHYPINDDGDEEKIIPKWFYLNLPYHEECEYLYSLLIINVLSIDHIDF